MGHARKAGRDDDVATGRGCGSGSCGGGSAGATGSAGHRRMSSSGAVSTPGTRPVTDAHASMARSPCGPV